MALWIFHHTRWCHHFVRAMARIHCRVRIYRLSHGTVVGDTEGLLPPTCEISDTCPLHPEAIDILTFHGPNCVRRQTAGCSLLNICTGAQSQKRIRSVPRRALPHAFMVQATCACFPTESSAATSHTFQSELGR